MNAAAFRDQISQSIRRTASMFSVSLREEDIEDLTQDVLLRLWEKQPTCAPECRPAYAAKTARNLTVDALRRRGALKRSERLTIALEDEDVLTDRVASPLASVIARDELSRFVAECRRHVPQWRLRLFLLIYGNGLRSKEAARLTGHSASGIDSAVHRAKQQLGENGIYVAERAR